ncbi:MAG TPA: EamA family transporter [Anaeromyxobacteraceae bacterium]|nr:EamA family transporter [Anaeromyxobacteraceae bacterium]
MSWFTYALLSAGFAGATAILAKIGVQGIPSTLATAVRTCFILPFTWAVVLVAGDYRSGAHLSRRTLLFLGLSGATTGLSWLAYFRALQLGPASHVAPIDKLSLPLTIVLAATFLREPMTPRLIAGVLLMACGALLTVR